MVKDKLFTLLFTLIILMFFLTLGCGESRIHSVTSDSPYLNIDSPYLVLKNEHFGGGFTVDNGKRTYFAGGEIWNFGNKDAYSVTIRIRIFQKNGSAYDDFNIYLGDIKATKYVQFNERFEVISPYGYSQIILTYQDDTKVHTVELNPKVSNINILEKDSY